MEYECKIKAEQLIDLVKQQQIKLNSEALKEIEL